MKILGIHDGIDSGAAIIVDGKIVSAIGEERVIRSKLAWGFPRAAIRACMEVAEVGPEDIDLVAVATKNNYLIEEITRFKGWYETRKGFVRLVFMSMASRISTMAVRLGFLEKLYYSLRTPMFIHRRRRIRRIMKEEFGFNCPVEFVDHHLAHASSAYYSSGYDDATVITLDGGGDGISSSVYDVRNGKFTRINENTSLNSIGNFYSYVTHICGFTTHKHEGKITGLAAYGEPKYIDLFRSLLEVKNGKINNKSKHFGTNAIKRITDSLPEGYSRADLAASVQQFLEEVCTKYISHWSEKTGLKNLALAGGVFANVKVNQRLHELGEGLEIFVSPAMGDDGVASGAAQALYYKSQPSSSRKAEETSCLENVYFGPEYSDEEVRVELEEADWKYTLDDDVEKEISVLLSEGYVVARFNERMEFGPRALGNRSILYQPTDPSVNDWLNKNLNKFEHEPNVAADCGRGKGRQ